MINYIQEPKNIARRKSIEFAINTLTKERTNATITRLSYVRDVYEYLKVNGNIRDKQFIEQIKEDEINRWETFYNSRIRKKSSDELTVAYLCGPNPENDLREFTAHGIIPENVYAFESDQRMYDEAIINTLTSEFPYIKIYKGRIEKYFKILQTKFDIIYLDFCGTLASSKTISVLRDLFAGQKLNSPGVVITNFSIHQRHKGKDDHWDNLITFSSNYLYPKSFTENLEQYGGGIRESANAFSLMPHDYLKLSFQNPYTVYSQCITRLLYDLPGIIVPYQRFAANKDLIDTFFKNFEQTQLPIDRQEDIAISPDNNSLIWGLNNFFIRKVEFDKILEKIQRQLAIDSDNNKLLETLNLMSFFVQTPLGEKYNSEKLNEIEKRWKQFEKYIFCDLFQFHQLKKLLIYQLTSPYLYNVAKTKRWTYKAKTNRMFVDAITYDECKYIFDWMPTLDLFEKAVNTLDRQLILRFALDSISKHTLWYNQELFMGTAVISRTEEGFEGKELKRRIKIN